MNPRKVQVEKFQKLGKKHNMPVGGMFHYQWGENRINWWGNANKHVFIAGEEGHF